MGARPGILLVGTLLPVMAEELAATATAMAPDTGSASGDLPAMSAARETKSMELNGDATFDVESLLAGNFGDTETTDEEPTDAENEETAADDETAADATSETDEETETSEDAEADPEASTEDTEDAELLKALKPKAVKRFNKLLEQRDAALAEAREAKRLADELQTKLAEEGTSPVPVKLDSDPLAVATNEEQLEAHERHYKDVLRWCRRNPNGGTPPPHLTGGQEMDFDQNDVMDNLETAESMLEAIPQRREFLTQFRDSTAQARKDLPEMFTKGTPENQEAQKLQRKLLAFHRQPDQNVLLAKLVKLERMEREEREGIARYPRVPLEKGKAAPKAAVTAKPAVTTKPSVPAVRPTSGPSSQNGVLQKLSGSSDAIDVEDLLNAV